MRVADGAGMSVLTFQTGDFVRIIASRGDLVNISVPVDYVGACGQVADLIVRDLYGVSVVMYSVAFANQTSWTLPGRLLERCTMSDYLNAPDPGNARVETARPKPTEDFPGHPRYRIVGTSPRHAMVYVELTTTGERRWVSRWAANLSIPEAFFDASPRWAPEPEDMEITA